MTLDEIRGRATITIEEAAELLDVSRATAYRAARDDRLPVVRLNAHRHLVKVPALIAMLESHDR